MFLSLSVMLSLDLVELIRGRSLYKTGLIHTIDESSVYLTNKSASLGLFVRKVESHQNAWAQFVDV